MYPLPAWKREPSAPLQRTPGQLPGLVASSGTVRSESGKGRLQSNRTDRNKSRRGAAGSDKPDACGRGAYGTGHRDGRRGARKHHYFLSRGLVGEREVKDLPLNGRSFDTLITLNPGTINFTINKGGPAGTGGNLFSVAGRRGSENLTLMNGVQYTGAGNASVTPGGVSGSLMGIDAVREYNVVSSTYGADYGTRSGAQVSIVTQSGPTSFTAPCSSSCATTS